MFNKIEMLKNANKYYLNMYGEIGEVADWCFTTGIINEMQPQGNVFNSEKEALQEKARRFLKQEIKEFRNECNSYWQPCFGDGKVIFQNLAILEILKIANVQKKFLVLEF